MEKIASFTIDHLRLQTGLYVSRVDCAGQEKITTFDIRMTRPNTEPVMDTAAVHAIEHLGATWLRNDPQWKDRVERARKPAPVGDRRRSTAAGPAFEGRI